MLKICQRQIHLELLKKDYQQLEQELAKRFQALLAGVRSEYLKRLGLPEDILAVLNIDSSPKADSELAMAELYLPEPGTIYFVKYKGSEKLLEAGAISTENSSDKEEIFEAISSVLSEEMQFPSIDWQTVLEQSTHPEDCEPAQAEISERELEAATELKNRESRQLVEKIAQKDSITAQQLQTSMENDGHDLLDHLESLELIRKDFAVIDRQSGRQILRVPDRASLEEASQKFFIGGAPLSEDNVDEVISTTSFCRTLLHREQWLLFLLLGALNSLKLKENVLVSSQEDQATRVFVDINQQKFLFLLNTKRLTLDDAYHIEAQITAYDIDDVTIISTHKISQLMRNHLQKNNPEVPFNFIENLEGLADQVNLIVIERQREQLKTLLSPINSLTPVKIHELIIEKIAPCAKERQASVEESAPKEESSQEAPSQKEVVAKEDPLQELQPTSLPSVTPIQEVKEENTQEVPQASAPEVNTDEPLVKERTPEPPIEENALSLTEKAPTSSTAPSLESMLNNPDLPPSKATKSAPPLKRSEPSKRIPSSAKVNDDLDLDLDLDLDFQTSTPSPTSGKINLEGADSSFDDDIPNIDELLPELPSIEDFSSDAEIDPHAIDDIDIPMTEEE